MVRETLFLHWKVRGLTRVEVNRQIDDEGRDREFLYYHEEDEERIFEEERRRLIGEEEETRPLPYLIDLSDHPHNFTGPGIRLPKNLKKPKIINAEQIFKSDECTICLSNPSNVLFCNCGHLCLCIECNKVKSLNTCPVYKTENTIKRTI